MAFYYIVYPAVFSGGGVSPVAGTPTQVFAGVGGTIAGAINGVNTVYILPSAPTSAGSVEVFLDGEFQRQTVDYTIVGSTITFGAAPLFGQFLDVFYEA